MRIISVGTLKAFWDQPGHRDAEQPLRTWARVVKAARWADPTAVKQMSEPRAFCAMAGLCSTLAATSSAWLYGSTTNTAWSMYASPVRTVTTTRRSEERRVG